MDPEAISNIVRESLAKSIAEIAVRRQKEKKITSRPKAKTASPNTMNVTSFTANHSLAIAVRQSEGANPVKVISQKRPISKTIIANDAPASKRPRVFVPVQSDEVYQPGEDLPAELPVPPELSAVPPTILSTTATTSTVPPSEAKTVQEAYQNSRAGVNLDSQQSPTRLTNIEATGIAPSQNIQTPAQNIGVDPPSRTRIGNQQNAQPLATQRFAPPKKLRRTQSTAIVHREIIDTSNRSKWYVEIKVNDKTFSRGNAIILGQVKDIIKRYIEADKRHGDLTKVTKELREKIHDMEFYKFLNESIIKKSKVLEENGLLAIFTGDDKDRFLYDIRADAELLWKRWMEGDFDCDLLRGIESSKNTLAGGKQRSSYKAVKKYPYKKPANYPGSNNLINGQWWPSRLAVMRDGAHGEQEAGIFGNSGEGAFAVVVASGGYADQDNGDTLEYCGTQSETSKPTKSTKLMQEALLKNQAVRVLRAANQKSLYAPKKGIRYDGLYDIIDEELLDEKTAMFRYTLRRQEGQDPIRYQGDEQKPTRQELAEVAQLKDLMS